ncbi:MAG: hypothetical protein WC389_14510, partial [Lutibacter sp.]
WIKHQDNIIQKFRENVKEGDPCIILFENDRIECIIIHINDRQITVKVIYDGYITTRNLSEIYPPL